MSYIIKRKEAAEIQQEKSWLLVYGRRKVGKTFLLRNLCRFKQYFFIKRNLSILHNEKAISIEEFVEQVKTILKQGKTVVVDEFQRLGEDILEEIMAVHPKGRLIISGSSFRIVEKFLEPGSPLLGFLMPTRIEFITPSDAISGLKKNTAPDKTIELATFMREPWIIPMYNQENVLEFVYKLVTKSKHIITSLVGEIFVEEERELTKKYNAVLSLIGAGEWNTKRLTSIMYAKKLIPSPSPTHLIQYMRNLEEIGLVESIKLYKSKEKYYRLASPIMNIFYYLDDRYNISERDVSFDEVKPTLQKLVNIEIQNFIAEIFAKLYNGRKEYFNSPNKEIDFIITVRNKPEALGEVKWKKFEKKDLEKFRKNCGRIYGRKVFFVKRGQHTDKDIDIINAKKIIKMIEKAGVV